MKHIYFFITLIFVLITDVTAQVTLVAPTKMVRTGDSVVVELRAKSRETLSTLQFTLSWNASLLSFGRVDTTGGLPPSAVTDEFNLLNTATGKLSYVWLTTTNGFRVVDSVETFKVVFKAIGANGTNCPLQFVPSPTSIKASNGDFISIAVTTQEGSVKIGTTAINEQISSNIFIPRLLLEQNNPNPFHNQTVIPFSLLQSDDVILAIYDFKGLKVLEKKAFFRAGKHEWVLNTEGVLSNGFYVYSVRTHDAFESKVFIKR
jgi:hypothetical protein